MPEKRYASHGDDYYLQHLGVPGMPGTGGRVGEDEDTVRYLDVRAVRSHLAHIKDSRSIPCAFCEQGLDAAIISVEAEEIVVEDSLVQGGGTDEEGDAPLARGDGQPPDYW